MSLHFFYLYFYRFFTFLITMYILILAFTYIYVYILIYLLIIYYLYIVVCNSTFFNYSATYLISFTHLSLLTTLLFLLHPPFLPQITTLCIVDCVWGDMSITLKGLVSISVSCILIHPCWLVVFCFAILICLFSCFVMFFYSLSKHTKLLSKRVNVRVEILKGLLL